MISGVTGITNGKSPDEPPATWDSSPAIWTDLNAPMELSSGEKVFPILDPKSSADGYSISFSGTTSYQPAPMPVRWLYVLQDGSLVAPTGSGKTASVPGETATNKIVGRIAFWTDDDTCKVNINTASAGTFWDVPRACSTLPASGIPDPRNPAKPIKEQELGYYQPIQHEFQRYPGHPAMTDLRAVFTGTGITADQIFNIVPRVIGGGSTQGTIRISGSTAALSADSDRLYASVDELVFNPDRAPNSGLTKAQVEQAKFFLTAHSRAPETNLFNLPRIACWPIHADLATTPDSAYTSAFDRLIAFCASTGTGSSLEPYYFQRQNALSITDDISINRNQELYAYLQYLTGRPIRDLAATFPRNTPPTATKSSRRSLTTSAPPTCYDSTLAYREPIHERIPRLCRSKRQWSRRLRHDGPRPVFHALGTRPRLYLQCRWERPQDPSAALGRLSSNVPEADASAFNLANKGANRVLGGKALEPGEK